MRFPYTRYPAEPTASNPGRTVIDLPHIPIRLVGRRGRWVRILALVDSGADISYFGAAHARFLGLDIQSGVTDGCTGIGGPSTCYYHQDIRIEVGGHELALGAHFSQSWGNDFAILGRQDFFDAFRVVIDEKRKFVELTVHH